MGLPTVFLIQYHNMGVLVFFLGAFVTALLMVLRAFRDQSKQSYNYDYDYSYNFAVDTTFTDQMRHDILDSYQTAKPYKDFWFTVEGESVPELDALIATKNKKIWEDRRRERAETERIRQQERDKDIADKAAKVRSSLFPGE